MKQQLGTIRDSAVKGLARAKGQQALEALRVRHLGKKGELTSILKQMGGLSAEERPVVGQLANQVRSLIEEELAKRASELKDQVVQARLEQEKLDVALPGKHHELGVEHPLSIILDETEEILVGMGSEVINDPEVECDHYNFGALNTPKNHPARDTQDTFYISDNIVLRTQISPVQVRVMERTQPPICIISPGHVYRSDVVDAAHSPLFHQIEGFAVDEGVTFANLKDTLETFVKRLCGGDSIVRFRPRHFPFTKPSAKVDVRYFNCHGEGCHLCKGEDWIEILGCGTVCPKMLSDCGIDPEVYSGFALSMGLEHVVMRRYNIDDLCLFYENGIRFLKQFQEVSPE